MRQSCAESNEAYSALTHLLTSATEALHKHQTPQPASPQKQEDADYHCAMQILSTLRSIPESFEKETGRVNLLHQALNLKQKLMFPPTQFTHGPQYFTSLPMQQQQQNLPQQQVQQPQSSNWQMFNPGAAATSGSQELWNASVMGDSSMNIGNK